MKLYTNPNSPNCTKVTAVAYYLGIDLDQELIDLVKGDQRKAEFLAVNPNGLVPTLQDGTFVLWESNAIMQYLASQKSGNSLWPQNDKVRADINRWQFWQQGHWGRALGTLLWEKMVKKFFNGGDPNPTVVKEAQELLTKHSTVLNHHLEGREWLVGNNVTLADFSVAAPLVYAQTIGVSLDGYPHIQKWYANVCALEAWKKSLPPILAAS